MKNKLRYLQYLSQNLSRDLRDTFIRLIKIIFHVNLILGIAFPLLWLFEQAPRKSPNRWWWTGSLASCEWGREEWNTTEQLNYQLSSQTKPLAMTYMVFIPTATRTRGVTVEDASTRLGAPILGSIRQGDDNRRALFQRLSTEYLLCCEWTSLVNIGPQSFQTRFHCTWFILMMTRHHHLDQH